MSYTQRLGAAAPQYDRLLRLLEGAWDFQQRVKVLGVKDADSASVTIRSLASQATDFVQLHVQTDAAGEGGSTYDTVNYTSTARVDCRAARQQDHVVANDQAGNTYVWLIPVFLEGDQTTYTKYDGVDGDDHMASVTIPSVADGSYLTPKDFTYDGSGNLTRIDYLDGSGHAELDYVAGVLDEMRRYDSTPTLLWTKNYTYDGSGYLTDLDVS